MPTLSGSLLRVLEPFRLYFRTPTFTTFVTLLTGMTARPAQRTVCGMLSGAGPAGVWHHRRAHRFFAPARWNPDTVGLTVLRLIVGHLIPAAAPLTVAVDDTLFRRSGRKVHAAHWGYDGSLKVAKGNQKLSRGNTFVVAAVVVALEATGVYWRPVWARLLPHPLALDPPPPTTATTEHQPKGV